MKKFLFLLSAASWLSSYAMDFSMLLNKPRKFGSNIFQVSFLEKTPSTPNPLYRDSWYQIPRFGFYSPTYPFAETLALISFEPHMISSAIPQDLQKALITSIMPGKSLQELFSTRTIYTNMVILGHLDGYETYNTVYHLFTQLYTGQKMPSGQNVPMGIFAPHGLISAASGGIALNTFKPEQVIIHNGGNLAYSPNNAKITVLPNRSISTF